MYTSTASAAIVISEAPTFSDRSANKNPKRIYKTTYSSFNSTSISGYASLLKVSESRRSVQFVGECANWKPLASSSNSSSLPLMSVIFAGRTSNLRRKAEAVIKTYLSWPPLSTSR